MNDMNKEELYAAFLDITQKISIYQKENGYSVFDEPDDPEFIKLLQEKKRLQVAIKKCEILEIIENSYIFAVDNDYWLAETKKKLEEIHD